jgi:histidyl-tRNA synthetase
MKVRSIRGFSDVLPDDVKRWHHIEESARNTFEEFGFSEIRIPVLEFTEIFARSIGASTDIVEKEMYTFTDRDGSSITLRPEGTAGVVRAYIENSMYTKSPISKLYYMGIMFRHERPQKGRYRGFYQIGAELFGTKDPYADAEVIVMLWRFLEKTEVSSLVRLELSSLGDENCRPAYKQKLVEYFSPLKKELCENCQRRLELNPLRILDCKEKSCKEITMMAPTTVESLGNDCKTHIERVKSSLDTFGIKYIINPKIVRGLDYYTRTVFEITTEELGAQNAVAAGGRYDGLVGEFGGPPTPAIGFSIGMERLVMLHEKTVTDVFQREIDYLVAYIGEGTKDTAFKIAYDLRARGLSAEIGFEIKSLKSQLKRADKLGVKHTIIVGEEELGRGKVKIRDMKSSSEKELTLDCLKKLPTGINA